VDSQAINPYSYIGNNPLSGTDPTGYCVETDSPFDCGEELLAGESEDITDENGNVVGTVSRGNNNEKIFKTNKEGAVAKIISNGYKGEQQTIRSVNQDKISDLESRLSEIDPLTNSSEFSQVVDEIGFRNKFDKFLEKCESSGGGCFNANGNSDLIKLQSELTKAFGNLVAGSAGAGGVGSTRIATQSSFRTSTVVESILSGKRIGTALEKADSGHRAASFLSRAQLMKGKTFKNKGGDGITRTLFQVKGQKDGINGIFEYIVTPKGQVSHQRFIKGGKITGKPNQTIK